MLLQFAVHMCCIMIFPIFCTTITHHQYHDLKKLALSHVMEDWHNWKLILCFQDFGFQFHRFLIFSKRSQVPKSVFILILFW